MESSGYSMTALGTTGGFVTEVLVLDRGYNCAVVWSSLSTMMNRECRFLALNRKGLRVRERVEQYQATARRWPLEKRRSYAADLAARLNAEAAA